MKGVIGISWAVAVIGLAAASCSNKSESIPVECATAPEAEAEAAQPERVVLKKTPTGDRDWCRACVVGPHGFMSCQRVVAESASESRGALQQRARDKACEDSGFKKDACPDAKVIAISCKGDPPPEDKTAAGKAMLNALKNSGPLILKQDEKETVVMEPLGAGKGEKEDAASAPASKDAAGGTPAAKEPVKEPATDSPPMKKAVIPVV